MLSEKMVVLCNADFAGFGYGWLTLVGPAAMMITLALYVFNAG